MDTLWGEPSELAAGDALSFKRSLSSFPASGGWSLVYELRGQAQAIEFTSTADTDGRTHVLLVLASVTQTWLPGDYVLAGFAINISGERHQIYYGDLVLGLNMPATTGAEDVKTFAQKMVAKYEALLLEIADSNLTASQVGSETKFTYEEQKNIRTEHGYWVGVRQHEVAMLRAKAGKPTGLKIRPIFRVSGIGPTVGMFGRGSGYNGW